VITEEDIQFPIQAPPKEEEIVGSFSNQPDDFLSSDVSYPLQPLDAGESSELVMENSANSSIGLNKLDYSPHIRFQTTKKKEREQLELMWPQFSFFFVVV
jgi:hypothetical protein